LIREKLRNIAIIAHVDHGKTTLVDEMLKQGGAFRENQVVQDRVMDNTDLEREKGITILAKNTSILFNEVKINIVDTPGHADFGGEVERVLKMVNGVLLLVDAFEGPMPQTRFVLQKALEIGHKVIIVINKIDRPDARLNEIGDEVLELLMELEANYEQLDSPIVYCSARQGIASLSPDISGDDLSPLFNTIISYFEPPQGEENEPLQVLISSIDYNDYVGRISIGRIERGTIRQGQEVAICNYHQKIEPYKSKVTNIYQFEGLKREAVETAMVGDIIVFSGIENVSIGDTICSIDKIEAIPFVKISEPTVEMTFSVNDSPFAGKEGKFVTSRHLRDRLFKELLKDVSLRVSTTDNSDSFQVCGRGEMHLSILIETMRREGFEFQVSNPRVLIKNIEGIKCEPFEKLLIDVPENCVGTIIEKIGQRKGELHHMSPLGNRIRMEFLIPSRGLFGYRSGFLTDTKGEGIFNSIFHSYQSYKGEIPKRPNGALIAFETGESVAYGLFNAQERGILFIKAGVKVYSGMIVGVSPKCEDLVVNVCKKKQMTNVRASGSDDALKLITPYKMSIEEALEFIEEDELLEITPKSFRIRKRTLSHSNRMRENKKK